MRETIKEVVREYFYYRFGWVIALSRRGVRYGRVWAGEAIDKAENTVRNFWLSLWPGVKIAYIITKVIAAGLAAGFLLSRLAFVYIAVFSDWIWIAISAAFSLLVAGIAVAFHKASEAENVARKYEEREHTLDTDIQPDGAPYNAFVTLRVATNVDRNNYINEFLAVPEGAKSVMLLLRQTRREGWFGQTPNTWESMKRQLEWRNGNERAQKIDLQWVVIRNKYNTFEAYIDFKRFENDILNCNKTAYAELLNTRDVREFKEMLQKLMDSAKGQKDACIIDAKTIAGLGSNGLPMQMSDREALALLTKRRWNEAMLITPDYKHFGMLTLFKLLERAVTNRILGEGQIDMLEQRVNQQINEAKERAVEAEKHKIQSPPADTGDDNPIYDASIPRGSPPQRDHTISSLTPP